MSDVANTPTKLLHIKAELSHMIEKYATNESQSVSKVDFIKVCAHLRYVADNVIKVRNKLNAVLNEELHRE